MNIILNALNDLHAKLYFALGRYGLAYDTLVWRISGGRISAWIGWRY